MQEVRTTCSLCEACCGAIMDVEGDTILRVRPDPADPLALGFICAKGSAIPAIEADIDRLHSPMLRFNGRLEPVSWGAAFSFIDERLSAIRAEFGSDAIAAYAGNGAGHSVGMFLYLADFMGALGTKNIFTAGTIDQIPRQAVSALLFGSPLSVTVPDLDRCKLLWIMGANPAESNGSMVTAPGFLRRIDRIKAGGGRVVVIDPRRTLTAKRSNEHIAIRPSADAAFLAAVAHVLLREGPAPSRALSLCEGISNLHEMLAPFSPERVASSCDIPADVIERLALELRDTDAAAIYGRMGVTTQRFSSLVCWLIDLVNILAGNLDSVGGAMFTSPLYAQDNTLGRPGRGEGVGLGRWKSRVSETPEVLGELPLHCLPEEIETGGQGQVRALFVVGGNPAVSNPDAVRLGAALDSLDLLVCVDIYANETSRRADVILPGPPRLTKSNYDVWFYQFAVRHYGRLTMAHRALREGEVSEREILLRLAAIARGEGWQTDVDADEERALKNIVDAEITRKGSTIEGRDPEEIMRELRRLPPLERRLDFSFRIGPHGDAFGSRGGISIESLKAAPQGLDLGPLAPRLPGLLRTRSGLIELMQPFVPADLERLSGWLDEARPKFVLVGRRQLRSANSWMHNIEQLQHRSRECTLLMNNEDAAEFGLISGDYVTASTCTGSIDMPVEVTGDIARGVVSLPHGWGHQALAGFQSVASRNPGVNVNVLTTGALRDNLTGTVQVNGFPVSISIAEKFA